jgi:hypothetical protein
MLLLVVFCMSTVNVHEIWTKWSSTPKLRHSIAVIGLGLISFFNLSRVSSWVYFQF